MDGMSDPSMVILSDPDYQEADEQSEESPDYLRGRLEEAERRAQERDIELSRHQQALQAILVQQQEQARQQAAQQSYQTYQQTYSKPQQSSQSEDPWREYLDSINGGSNVDSQESAQQQRQLTVDEAAAMADQIAQRRISETLSAINQDTAVGNALAQRFQTQDSDLMPYSDVVASYYAANQHLPKAQAYEIAVNTTRNLLKAGRLAPVSQVPQSPMGGQWRANSTGQSQPGVQYRRIDDELRREELQRWTQQRKDLFEKRRQAQY